MTTHDVLAYAIASETVKRVRNASPDWSHVFSADVHLSASRSWPQPDFVLVDTTNDIAMAAEFKPPAQTKREYLTGLGQAIAYTRDFAYSALVIPDFADDGYPIALHIGHVLEQQIYDTAPVALLTYNPATLAPQAPAYALPRKLQLRASGVPPLASLDDSFFAKWRDISPGELGLFLAYLYEEGQNAAPKKSVRDRAFSRLWQDMTTKKTMNWSGTTRTIKNPASQETSWGKNYRNFVTHLGWLLPGPDGRLTAEGLEAHHVGHLYGSDSRVFLDHIARGVLVAGKHLVLINAINAYQDSLKSIPTPERQWLDEVELHLENEGLLKRNPGRHAAAKKKVVREFMKSEKTLWRKLELVVPNGGRVFHRSRGFIFNWERITSLVS